MAWARNDLKGDAGAKCSTWNVLYVLICMYKIVVTSAVNHFLYWTYGGFSGSTMAGVTPYSRDSLSDTLLGSERSHEGRCSNLAARNFEAASSN